MSEQTTVQHGLDPNFDRMDFYAICLCGSGMDWFDCWDCNGEGGLDDEALMEMDPLWYQSGDFKTCDTCHGRGGEWVCYRAQSEELLTPAETAPTRAERPLGTRFARESTSDTSDTVRARHAVDSAGEEG